MSISRLIIFMALALCFSCANDSKTADNDLGKPAKTANNSTQANNAQPAAESGSIVSNINLPEGAQAPPVQKPPEPAQNADGVWHYTCAKGCKGGGAAATKCATCGEMLKHNSAYHGNPSQPAPGIGNVQAQPGTSPVQLTPPAPRPTEPAQNTAGVWHFTCPKGCTGGGAAKAPCGKCGAELAHNQSYHN